jgi:methionine-rich copper-binding protein CopC
MSIKITNQVYYRPGTGDNGIFAGDNASISLFYRQETETVLTGMPAGRIVEKEFAVGLGITISNSPVSGDGGQEIQMAMAIKDAAGHNGSLATQPRAVLGVVNHIAIVYRNGAPSYMYFNGIPTPFSPTMTAAVASAWFSMGNKSAAGASPNVFSLENVAVWNNYALTPEEVVALRDAVALPDAIGGSATFRGWWKFTGAVGTTPALGDPGLANSIAGQGLSVSSIGGVPTNAVYGGPLAFTPSVKIKSAYASTSGKAIFFRFGPLSGTGDTVPTAVYTRPSVLVNGTPVANLGIQFLTGVHTVMGYLLPSGTQVNAGDTVTATVANGWAGAKSGLARGETIDVANRVGKSMFRADDYVPPVRMGFNMGSTGPQWYASGHVQKNFLRKLNPNWFGAASISNDGLPLLLAPGSTSSNAPGFMGQLSSPTVDPNGYPSGPRGLWAVGWDDSFPNTPTTAYLQAQAQSSRVTERLDLANPGVAGVGKVRVFDVQWNDGPVTLTSAITTTPAPLTVETINLSSTANMFVNFYLKFDNEYMQISSIVNSTQVTARRGAASTTPATHSAGTVGTFTPQDYFGSLTIGVTPPASTKVPSLGNFVVYEPGDFTYTDGVPVVLDKSDPLALNSRIKADCGPDIGVMRWMDNTGYYGGQDDMVEPEELRIESHFSWGAGRSKPDNVVQITGATAFPTTGGYIYSSHMGETYTATLGSPITTTPPKETVETIVISDALTAPVVNGQILTIGSEKLRIISTNGTTTVTVERGAMGTATATHSTGSITVSCRLPCSLDNFTKGSAPATIGSGACLQMTTTTPHGLATGMKLLTFGSVSNPDINISYRFATTLTSTIATTGSTTTLTASMATARNGTSQTISVASSSGATVGAVVRVDSELLLVTAAPTATSLTVTRGAGGSTCAAHSNAALVYLPETITVASTAGMVPYIYLKVESESMKIASVVDGTTLRVLRGNFASTAATHASGLPATTYLPGFILSDGGSYDIVGDYSMVYVTGPNSIVKIPGRGSYATIGPDQVIDGSKMSVTVRSPRSNSYPYSFTAKATAEFPNAKLWVNIPHTATDGMIYKIAKQIRDNWPAGRTVLVEYSNETWNFGFWQTQFAFAISALGTIWQSSPRYYVVWRSGRMAEIFRQVFDEDGANRSGEIELVLGCQFAATSVAATALAAAQYYNIKVDRLGVAPYLDGSKYLEQYHAQVDNDTAIDLWINDVYYFSLPALYDIAYKPVLDQTAALIANYNAATGYNCKMIGYEGGVEKIIGTTVANPVPNSHARNIDATYRPNMYIVEQDVYALYSQYMDTYALFNMINGYFVDPNFLLTWGLYTWGGQQRGRGDGSDGKFDNRTLDIAPGLPTSKAAREPYESKKVSVRGQAYIDWNAAVAGAGDVTPPGISSRSPAIGATGVSLSAVVTATFSEAVQAGTISITLSAGGSPVAGTTTYNPGNFTATFTPTASLSGGVAYTVNVSSAADTSGNVMTPVTWSFTTTSGDTAPPTVVARTPAPGATDVPLLSTVSVTFSEAIVSNSAAIALSTAGSPGVAGSTTYNAGTLTSTFTPSSPLDPGVAYSVVASGATDSTGNTMTPVSWGFTTFQPDVTAPTIVSRSPAADAVDVPVATVVTATFSEALQAGTVAMALADLLGNQVAGSLAYNAGTLTASFTPSSPLVNSKTYAATVSAAADATGNVMTTDTWSFTTVDPVAPPAEPSKKSPMKTHFVYSRGGSRS